MKLSVCLLASEAAPLSKTGGLADVSAALTKHLHAAGHDVRLFTPWYRAVGSWPPAQPVAGLQELPLQLGPHALVFSVFSTALPGSQAPVMLIDCPPLYGRSSIYTMDEDEHLRFLAFTRAVLLACRQLRWAPQILHCNDWHTSFAPLFLKAQHADDPVLGAVRTVLTIHNVGYQGVFSAKHRADLGLEEHLSLLYPKDLEAGYINALRHGILYADAITTVSPTHAREICSEEYGMGLQDSLRARADVLCGILNGVDYSVWDPRVDRYLPLHYDADRLAVKAALKRELLARLKLEAGDRTPLGGIVSRLASQKGIELLLEALPRLLAKRSFAFVALGAGDGAYEEQLASLARDLPGRVLFQRGYDDEMAHWIEAACDLFVMPSLYEPSGLNQMYSLRYGTVPVVRRTGGLADSVEQYDPATGRGTGLLFDDFKAEALESALDTALDLHARPMHWSQLIRNGMSQDFSWEHQGGEYVKLYQEVLADRGHPLSTAAGTSRADRSG
jgi:starch synthase